MGPELSGRKEGEGKGKIQAFLLKGEYEASRRTGNRKKGPSPFQKPEVGEPSQAKHRETEKLDAPALLGTS